MTRTSQKTVAELARDIERQRRGLRTMAVGLVCGILFVGGLGGLAIWNSHRIGTNQGVADTREQVDATALREAAWRGCQRDMLERAEQYVANGAVLKIPAFARLFPRELIEESVARRRERLPILDCDPNLCGRMPSIMSRRAQQGFIAAYARGLLPANPSPPPPPKGC